MRSIFLLLHESAANEEKLKHLEHLEDHPINAGVEGFKHAVNTLKAVHNTLSGRSKDASLMTKYDGSPAVVFGHHPVSGKFFVSTKSIHNVEPKINYTHEDIEKNHGHAPGLVSKLKTALDHLPKVSPSKGVFHGDIMHTSADVHEKEGKLHFKPNVINYSTPKNSEIGKKIAKSKIGVYVHTAYHGKDVSSMKADYTPDLTTFKDHPNVHLMKWGYDPSKAKYGEKEQNEFKQHLNAAEKIGKTLKPVHYRNIEQHSDDIKQYINHTIRSEETPTTKGLLGHVWKKGLKEAETLKTTQGRNTRMRGIVQKDKLIQSHKPIIDSVLQLHNHLQQAKNVHVNAMSAHQDFEHHIGDQKAKPEGFVAVVNNRPTKFVDRQEFSKQNFLAREQK